jgi:hypothetical protein
MKTRLKLVAFAAVALVFLCSIIYLVSVGGIWPSKTARPVPYQNSGQLLLDVQALPVIGPKDNEPTTKDWDAYIAVARRIQVTSPDITKAALRQLSLIPAHPRENLKCMLLIRVSFECRAGLVREGIHGGWLSRSPPNQTNAPRDMNWPVGRRLGRFYLMGTIEGYLGKPYAADEEFEWMLAHSKWRNL